MGTPVAYHREPGNTGATLGLVYAKTDVSGTTTLSGGTGNAFVRIVYASSGSGGLKAFMSDHLSAHNADAVIDGEICATVNAPTDGSTPKVVKGGVCARMSKTGDISGYLVQETAAGDASSWDLISYTDNSPETYTVIGTIKPAGVTSYPARVRYAYVGSTHWVKVWNAADSEPSWNKTGNVMRVKDSTKTTGGSSGVHAWGLATTNDAVEFDDVEWVAHNPIVAFMIAPSANTTDASSATYTFNGFANEVGLVWLGWTKGSAPDAATISCSGVTFSSLFDSSYATVASPNKRLQVWSYKIGSSDVTASANLSFSFSATQTGFIFGTIQLGGADNSSNDGSGAFRNAASNTPGTAGATNNVPSSGSMTFDNLVNTSGAVSVIGLNANTALTGDTNADFDGWSGHANPAHAAAHQFFDANESVITWTWTNNFTSSAWAAEVSQQSTADFYSTPSLLSDSRRIRRNVNLRR